MRGRVGGGVQREERLWALRTCDDAGMTPSVLRSSVPKERTWCSLTVEAAVSTEPSVPSYLRQSGGGETSRCAERLRRAVAAGERGGAPRARARA